MLVATQHRWIKDVAAGERAKYFFTLGADLFGPFKISPIHELARALLAAGHPPETLLTSRWADRDASSWTPAPISEWAARTTSESDNGSLTSGKWVPYSGPARDEAAVD